MCPLAYNYETDRCQIAVPLRANGLNHQKSIASNGPPQADVLPRSKSIHNLRELGSANNTNEDLQVIIDRELMDERDVAIWYEELEDELQAANNDDFLYENGSNIIEARRTKLTFGLAISKMSSNPMSILVTDCYRRVNKS